MANNFVTNILDINHQPVVQEGTRIKVLRPAEDFYEKLVIAWLMLRRSIGSEEPRFDDYMKNVKSTFGRSWREKYGMPTKYFYEKLTRHWEEVRT